jgi:MFS family permease
LILGPIVGGAFAENIHATWRWAFYINAPVIALICASVALVFPQLRLEPTRASVIPTLMAIDWTGVVLHFTFILLLCAALIFSGSTWAWNSGSAIAAWAVVGVVLLVYVR